MDKIWYEVAVSSKDLSTGIIESGTIESFKYLGNAKAFAVAMCENPDILLDRAVEVGVSESVDVIESVFIDRWAEGEIDETFPELKYYPQEVKIVEEDSPGILVMSIDDVANGGLHDLFQGESEGK